MQYKLSQTPEFTYITFEKKILKRRYLHVSHLKQWNNIYFNEIIKGGFEVNVKCSSK